MATAVTSYETMLSYLVDISSATEVLKKQALRQAGRKFCLDTELYEKVLDPIDVVSSTRTYDLSALIPSETQIIDIVEARNGASATDDTTAPMEKNEYSRIDESTFKFITTPTASVTDGLVVEVNLRPTVSSEGLETWFFDRYFEPIIAYTHYYLHISFKTSPFHDPALAQSYLEQYKELINAYKVEDNFRQELDVTAYSSMLAWLLPTFPDLEERMVNQQIALAGRKFCIDTELYEKTLDAIDVVSGTRTYDLSLLIPSGTKIIDIVEARNGADATDDTTSAMERIEYKLIDEDTFKYTTTPTASVTDGLVLKINLRPKANSNSIETWFYDRYFESLLSYSKYLLYLTQPESFQLAEFHLSQYKEDVEKYKTEDIIVQELDVTAYSDMVFYMTDIPGASPQIKEQALRQAGRKFCLDTELYKKTLDPIDVVADTRTYSLAALIPDETEVIRLGEVRQGDSATDDTTQEWDSSNYELEDFITFKYVQTPTESTTDGLVVEVHLAPTVESSSITTAFFSRYMEAIISYAKYYLLRMDSNKGWADKARADEMLNEYTFWLNRYRREKYYKYKSADVQIALRPNRFA